jgi:hypothetical protein
MSAYKWFLKGRVDPQSENDQVWPEPAQDGGWVKMGGSRLRRTRPSTASTLRDLPNTIWQELWEVELDNPSTNDHGIVTAKRGRLVRRIAEWNEDAAKQFCDDTRELRRNWTKEILALVPPGTAPSSPQPMFLLSSIIGARGIVGPKLAPQASVALNKIIRQNVADAYRLALMQTLPSDLEEEDDIFLTAKMVQNGSLFAAASVAFARKLSELDSVPIDFDWSPVMDAGLDAELQRQTDWFKRTLHLD